MMLQRISLVVFVYIMCFIAQSFFLLNHDVSWCIHAAERLLSGGTYVQDFFDINPPLALYLYTPVAIISNTFHISIVYALPIYVIILASLSLCVCYFLVKKIFADNATIFLTTLAFIFLILPLNDFGQREHLLIILTMPYFLVTIARLQNYHIPSKYGFAIGVIAFLGFVLKPYFLASFIFVESFYMYQTRKRGFGLRSEALTIGLVLFFYIESLFLVHTNYIHEIVPQALKYYYLGFHDPLLSVLFHPVVLFCLALTILFLFNRNANRNIAYVFLFSMWGFLIAYFLQKTVWVYHYFPILSMGLLLGLWQFLSVVELQKNNSHFIFNILLAIIIFGFPILDFMNRFQYGMSYKKSHLPLISYMNSHVKHRSVYVLTSRIHNIFPAVDYADAEFVSKFPHFSLLPGMIYKGLSYRDHLPVDLSQDQTRFIEMVVDDLQIKKPDFVFVDVQRYNSYLPDYLSFDYIKYFSKNDKFKTFWNSYQKSTYIELPMVFSIRPESARLYVVPAFADIRLSDIPGIGVILVGKGKHRTIYYTENSKFELWKDQRVSTPFDLTEEEVKFLKSHGKGLISKESSEVAMLNRLIARALFAGSPRMYAFLVYERKSRAL